MSTPNSLDIGAVQSGGLDVGAVQSAVSTVNLRSTQEPVRALVRPFDAKLRATQLAVRTLGPAPPPPVTYTVAAADAYAFADAALGLRVHVRAASDSYTFADAAATTAVPGVAGDAYAFADQAVGRTPHVVVGSAADAYAFADRAAQTLTPSYLHPNAQDIEAWSDRAQASRGVPGVGADQEAWSDLAVGGRAFTLAAADALAWADLARSNQFLKLPVSDAYAFADLAGATKVGLGASDAYAYLDRASAQVMLASGEVLPEGEADYGLRRVLYEPVSGTWPFCYAEDAEGLLLMANGVDPMLAWDGLAASAWPAGLVPPDLCVQVSGSGSGPLTGRRWGLVRFLDAEGRCSSVSPWGDWVDLGHDGFIQAVDYVGYGDVTVTSVGHGLVAGDVVTIKGVDARTPTGGVLAVDGTFAVDVPDSDHFVPRGLRMAYGHYQALGVWTMGSGSIEYQNLAVSPDPRVVRRQVLRNLEGDAKVFYVDIDTTDLASTTLYSSRTDDDLATSTAVPLEFDDREPNARRHDPPPSHKRAIVAHAGRIWATADAVVTQGAVSVQLGNQVVVGIGTGWTSAMAGRLLYVDGATRAYPIAQVLVPEQFLALEVPYDEATDPLASYAIRPAPIERRLVYYSEPGLPQSWPPWNAFAVPETSDEIVGLFALKGYLFVVKERHLYRFTYREDPASDGFVFPVAERGCVSNRCWCIVAGTAYLLDENGIYAFDGDSAKPVSDDQPLFIPDAELPYRVDWDSDRTLWSCVHDPQRGRILWFLDLVGFPARELAVVYDYVAEAWWLERYPEAIDSAALALVGGYRAPVAGTTARRVLTFGQATLDLVDPGAGTLRGTAASGDALTLHDPAAQFPFLPGVPVAFPSGAGAGLVAIVASNTSDTLTFVDPLPVPVDATTVYQVGGVDWTWRGSWRRLADDEAENPRDVDLAFRPAAQAATLAVRLYYDHAPTPAEWGFDWDSDGIRVKAGDTDVVVDLSSPRGYATFRTSGHRDPYGFGVRYEALELHGVQGADPQRIYAIELHGAE